MPTQTLYKRTANGKIQQWSIHLDGSQFYVKYSIIGRPLHIENIRTNRSKLDEYKSRIKEKRKDGYKAVIDLYDNAPTSFSDSKDLINYLDTYLPKNNTTTEGFVLPMLAKTLDSYKPFENVIAFYGQWKINGLRCIIGVKRNTDTLFDEIIYTYHSREGEDWTPKMKWMDELLDITLGDFKYTMIENDISLDGELYLPGYTVNQINSFVKNEALAEHTQLQYWCYDLCTENMSAFYRYSMLVNSVKTKPASFNRKEDHLNNKEQFIVLPYVVVDDYDSAVDYRDKFIDLGFEGLIMRNYRAEYAFGKRNAAMFKFKKKYDGKFEILDINKDKRGCAILILKNDINDEVFECTINRPISEQIYIADHPEFYKRKLAMVEYRERSGVKGVPFHAKAVRIITK